MTHLSELIEKDQLLKKSILLLKAWFTYESCLLGSYAACMATYALYVLVVFILNTFHEEAKTPMDVFRKFFEVWGHFDWEGHLITIYSPIRQANYYERLRNEVSVNSRNNIKSATLRWTDLQC